MFIPEITTTWNVKVHDDELERAISFAENDKLISTAGEDVLERLTRAKSDLENFGHEVAKSIGETQKSYQEEFIRYNQTINTGMMLNSTEITEDGMGTVHVGNTASSVDGFPYPLAIETGRREVYPINRKWLRWWDKGGNIVFAKHSKETDPKPFVKPSQEYTLNDVEEIVDKFVKNVFG